MNRKWLKISIVLLVMAALAVTAAAASAHPWGPDGGRGPGFGFGSEHPVVNIVVESLGIEADELVTELRAGKSIAQLAEENDVTLETIVEAIIAPRGENLTAAVEAGSLTQAQADAHLALLRANLDTLLNQTFDDSTFMPGMRRGGRMGRGSGMGRGMGDGFGFGRGWGFGFGNTPDTQVTPEATAEPNA